MKQYMITVDPITAMTGRRQGDDGRRRRRRDRDRDTDDGDGDFHNNDSYYGGTKKKRQRRSGASCGDDDRGVAGFLKEIGKKAAENENKNKKRRRRGDTEEGDDELSGGVDVDAVVDDEDSKHKKKKKKKDDKKRKKHKEKKESDRGDAAKKVVVQGDDDDHDRLRKTNEEEEEKKEERDGPIVLAAVPAATKDGNNNDDNNNNNKATTAAAAPLLPPHRYVLAPMVGASELAFRLLARRYGAQLAYTPMMDANQFASCSEYRRGIFRTCREDRPLVCHFAANDPDDFANAIRTCAAVATDNDNDLASPYCCDAVDLNLGCPQRTAYLGHFGSYLLDRKDRDLLCRIVRAGVDATQNRLPVFVKIRLLDKFEDTLELCRQLRSAGAALIAVHARYRATWERKGPGARDGPALLDQVAELKRRMPDDVPILANGNVVTYEDVVENLKSTRADGVMSAEGILDDPALFFPRFAADDGGDGGAVTTEDSKDQKKRRKLLKKLRSIGRIEGKLERGIELDEEQRDKLATKDTVLQSLRELERSTTAASAKTSGDGCGDATGSCNGPPTNLQNHVRKEDLAKLRETANDKVKLAREYLLLVRKYPATMRTVIFHVRRMLKEQLTKYQLMEECLECPSVDDVDGVLDKIVSYRNDPERFVYDREKAEAHREAMELRKRQEGRRKDFEQRMMRKAKREGKDPMHYLQIGAAVPTEDEIRSLLKLPRSEALEVWKRDHSQHCLSHHLDPEGCQRGRTCAFLHVDVNRFDEQDEVAG